ncbi:MAG: response regulator [Ignavibacteria bacterium]|nr:response regulator [Ignavibacteria bacterium]
MNSSKKKILFVDDDAQLRGMVKEQLSSAGYVLDEAGDAPQAMEMLQSGNYDLMLLDITLPGKSGMDVLKYVKEEGLRCRVIMLTGIVGLSAAVDSMKLGADDYVTKPYNMNYLLASIERILSN